MAKTVVTPSTHEHLPPVVQRLRPTHRELVLELRDTMTELDKCAAHADTLVDALRSYGVAWHVLGWATGLHPEVLRRRFGRRRPAV